MVILVWLLEFPIPAITLLSKTLRRSTILSFYSTLSIIFIYISTFLVAYYLYLFLLVFILFIFTDITIFITISTMAHFYSLVVKVPDN